MRENGVGNTNTQPIPPNCCPYLHMVPPILKGRVSDDRVTLPPVMERMLLNKPKILAASLGVLADTSAPESERRAGAMLILNRMLPTKPQWAFASSRNHRKVYI